MTYILYYYRKNIRGNLRDEVEEEDGDEIINVFRLE